jgi:hypothetical protein
MKARFINKIKQKIYFIFTSYVIRLSIKVFRHGFYILKSYNIPFFYSFKQIFIKYQNNILDALKTNASPRQVLIQFSILRSTFQSKPR